MLLVVVVGVVIGGLLVWCVCIVGIEDLNLSLVGYWLVFELLVLVLND